MKVAQVLWFNRSDLALFPIGTTLTRCPTCEKYAIRPDGVSLEIWDVILGFHMRDHLADQAATFLKDQ